MALTEWAVAKTTTDKLESELNDASAKGREVEQITWIGGRDWIVVSFRDLSDGELLSRRESHG